jgi:hypothetical protein
MPLRRIIYAGRNASKGHFRFVILSLFTIALIVMNFKTGQTLFNTDMPLRRIIYAGRNASKGHFRFVILSLFTIAQLVMHF